MHNYTELFNAISIPDLQQKIQEAQTIVITAHKSPDGDAVGSTLALWNALTNAGYNAKVVLPDKFPSFLKWMKGADQIVFFDSQTDVARKLISDAGVVFCLDYNDFSRVGKEMQTVLKECKAFKIMIDHHPDPSNECEVLISSTEECATAQMIFQFIVTMGWRKMIDPKTAECIYCGLLTDTGSFRFPSVKAKTHFIVAELMAMGLNNAYVHNQIFDNDSESRLRLLGYALSSKMKVLSEYKTAYFTLTKEELLKFNYQSGDTEGLVNYGLAVKGVMVAAIFIERDDQIKISFRSKGVIPVNLFSKTYFNGGGHTNAAGGSASCNLSQAESLFLDKLPEFIKQHAL